jgi:hypothetical protein
MNGQDDSNIDTGNGAGMCLVFSLIAAVLVIMVSVGFWLLGKICGGW